MVQGAQHGNLRDELFFSFLVRRLKRLSGPFFGLARIIKYPLASCLEALSQAGNTGLNLDLFFHFPISPLSQYFEGSDIPFY